MMLLSLNWRDKYSRICNTACLPLRSYNPSQCHSAPAHPWAGHHPASQLGPSCQCRCCGTPHRLMSGSGGSFAARATRVYRLECDGGRTWVCLQKHQNSPGNSATGSLPSGDAFCRPIPPPKPQRLGALIRGGRSRAWIESCRMPSPR